MEYIVNETIDYSFGKEYDYDVRYEYSLTFDGEIYIGEEVWGEQDQWGNIKIDGYTMNIDISYGYIGYLIPIENHTISRDLEIWTNEDNQEEYREFNLYTSNAKYISFTDEIHMYLEHDGETVWSQSIKDEEIAEVIPNHYMNQDQPADVHINFAPLGVGLIAIACAVLFKRKKVK